VRAERAQSIAHLSASAFVRARPELRSGAEQLRQEALLFPERGELRIDPEDTRLELDEASLRRIIETWPLSPLIGAQEPPCHVEDK
jgi:hypothetical protein